MYYPPLFTPVTPFDPRANPLEVPPVARENPLDLSNKQPISSEDAADMMLDHRKLANLAASHSLSAMGRQMLDPSLYRLAYGAEGATVLPGLTSPFVYDRATGVTVPTSLAAHPMMNSFLQQRERLEQQQQQAYIAAARSQQVAAAAAAAAAVYLDPASLPLHLRNGLTQREAAAALAATRGMYAPSLPTPMMLPAFSLYTEDKGAFTSLRSPAVSTPSAERSVLNGVGASPALEAARYAEHLKLLRDHNLQHQTSGKCTNSCCTSGALAGLGQSSVPCGCCVQTPSQAALCARSPMGCAAKDPPAAATGKICDFPQPGLTFLHRPAATTTAATTSSTSSGELRLSVSSLCTTQTNSEPTTVSSSRDKQHSVFRSWNSIPSASNGGKTAFSVPKKKEKDPSPHHSKEHRSSGSIKDILKDTQSNGLSETFKSDAPKISSHSYASKHDVSKKSSEKYPHMLHDDFSNRYNQRDISESNGFYSHKYPVISPVKPSNTTVPNGSSALTTVTSVMPIVTTRCDSGSIPTSKMPPLLEAVRPAEMSSSIEQPQDAPVHSPQGPPALIAVSNSVDYAPATVIKSPYVSSDSSVKIPSTNYTVNSIPMLPYNYQTEKSTSEASSVKVSSSSKSPKKPTSHSSQKYNGYPMGFVNGEHAMTPLAVPKPIPAKPIPQLPTHLTSSASPYSSHYRSAQHQLSLQAHNDWIPHANPNVTVSSLPQSATNSTTSSSTSVITSAHRPTKSQPPANSQPTAVQREPDYADTPNVLQSLLIRSAMGMDSMTSVPSSTMSEGAKSVITSSGGLPLFSLDYRFPIGPQINLVSANREGLTHGAISSPYSTQQNTNLSSGANDKAVVKSETGAFSFAVASKSKKRSSSPHVDESASAKKRILSSDYASQLPIYSFQPAAFIPEVQEAPECPYTFIPEPPINYTSQIKDEIPKPIWRELGERPQDVSSHRDLSKSPVLVPAKSPSKPIEPAWSPHSTLSHMTTAPAEDPQLCFSKSSLSSPETLEEDIRSRRELRRKLLARIHQHRRPLLSSSQVVLLDQATIDKQLAVRYAKKLLSQLTLRWAHRRFVHKWHTLKSSRSRRTVVQKRRRNGKVVYVFKQREGKRCKRKGLQIGDKNKDVSSDLVMPAEMKRLIVNKALGETQLHRAARLGYTQAVAYCLKSKCVSVNARDNAGYSPLHECCSRGHLDIARALLQYGADVNASAAGGIRPLHDAVENDHVEIVRLLLSYGADPTITTYSGLEPMKLARSAMMAGFLQGFLADISGEVDSRPHMPWRFWGSARCLDPEDAGCDVFLDVPSDPESEGEGDDDILFEVSDSPHLPTFRLIGPTTSSKAQCNYLRLNDVLRKLSMPREDFVRTYEHIEILSLPRHDFEAVATCNKQDNNSTRPISSDRSSDHACNTELVRLDKSIRKVLGIETISVR